MAINYIAVVGAAVASFLFGWLWYGPLFGKTWMKMMGFTPDSMKSMKMTPAMAMTAGFITMLVMSFVLAKFMGVFGVVDIMGALNLTFWLWIGFFATTMAGSVLWEGKSVNLYAFNAVYQFLSILVMAVVLTLWG